MINLMPRRRKASFYTGTDIGQPGNAGSNIISARNSNTARIKHATVKKYKKLSKEAKDSFDEMKTSMPKKHKGSRRHVPPGEMRIAGYDVEKSTALMVGGFVLVLLIFVIVIASAPEKMAAQPLHCSNHHRLLADVVNFSSR